MTKTIQIYYVIQFNVCAVWEIKSAYSNDF